MTIETNVTTGIRHELFAAIQYEKRLGKKGPMIGMKFPTHFVFKGIVQDAWKRFSASIVTADRSKDHTAKSLFNDPEGWVEYKPGHQIAIGRCLKYFVENKMLPLHCVNPTASGTKLYMVNFQ